MLSLLTARTIAKCGVRDYPVCIMEDRHTLQERPKSFHSYNLFSTIAHRTAKIDILCQVVNTLTIFTLHLVSEYQLAPQSLAEN